MGTYILNIPHVSSPRSLADNLTSDVKQKFHFKNGDFGTPSYTKDTHNNTRHIESDDPVKTSEEFMEVMVQGYTRRRTIPNVDGSVKGEVFDMKDGSSVTWRQYSTSDGSPAVDINVDKVTEQCPINYQKIHFVKEEKK